MRPVSLETGRGARRHVVGAGGEGHEDTGDGEADEGPQGHGGAAATVGEPATPDPADRAEEGPDEGDLRGVQARGGGLSRRRCGAPGHAGEEGLVEHLAEGEAEADERAERADVEQRDDPGVGVPQHLEHRLRVGRLVVEVVHEDRGADAGDGEQDEVDGAHDLRPAVAERRDDEQPDEPGRRGRRCCRHRR